MYLEDMKYLWVMLSLGQLYTENTNHNDDNDDDDDADNDTSDIDNNTWQANHDYIGWLAFMPNGQKVMMSTDGRVVVNNSIISSGDTSLH